MVICLGCLLVHVCAENLQAPIPSHASGWSHIGVNSASFHDAIEYAFILPELTAPEQPQHDPWSACPDPLDCVFLANTPLSPPPITS